MSVKKALCIAAAIVIPLTVLEVLLASYVSRFSVLAHVGFYLLFPGMAVFLLIAGGHGGTRAEEISGLLLGTAANVTCYTLLVFGVAELLRQRRPK